MQYGKKYGSFHQRADKGIYTCFIELKDYSMNRAVNPSFKSNNNPVNPILLFYSFY